ncbi:30S ribosomal protein S5 [Candidatus Parcubacteria bacterium]|nr:30S ribosomal protein S5 [Candidatus Parcubacteria bacterium]
MNGQFRGEAKEFEEKVLQVKRVSKKVKGGNKIGFSVLVVIGDRKGRVGVGLGKAPDVVTSIRKGVRRAKKNVVEEPLAGTTIPHELRIKLGAAKILLKPAPEGAGIIAGGPVRAVAELAGISDISAKILGTSNKASNVYATLEALRRIGQMETMRAQKR